MDSLKTDSTKDNYIYWLNKYLDYTKKKNHDELLQDTPDQIQLKIEDYVMGLKRRQKSKSAIKVSLYALFHFFAMNRVILNEKIIKKLMPEEDSKKRQAYTTEDVTKILEAIDNNKIKKHKKWYFRKPRARALVHFFASSAVRLGSIPIMKFEDIEKIENCYLIRVYAKTRHEYLTFLTPEASKSLDDYLATRTNLINDSSLFEMNYDAIRRLIYRLIIRAKVSPFTTVIKENSWNKIDQDWNKTSSRLFLDVPMVHGFRSRWNTIMKNNNEINKSSIEVMMGHTPEIKLDANYYKPTKENLFQEFKKGIDPLTIYRDV
ncbi:MAG: site-specific integrase [Nitrosarchaeum sp.]|nr:site-specific integrase [Nitrosarchaeum sp.]